MGNDPAVVKGEIRNDLQAALGCLDGNPALDQAASIFAYIKAARKIMENPPITITQEPLAGHRGWALTQPLSAIRQEARVQADTLRQLAAL